MNVIKSLVMISGAAALRDLSSVEELDHAWTGHPRVPAETYGIPRGNTYKYLNTQTGDVECGRVAFNTFPEPASQVPVLAACDVPLATDIDLEAVTGFTDETWGFGEFILLDRAPDMRGKWSSDATPMVEVIEQCGNRITIREDEDNLNRAWIHDFVEMNGEFPYGCVDYLVRAFPACEVIFARAFWGTSSLTNYQPCWVGVNSLEEFAAIRCLNPEDGTLTFFNPSVHGTVDQATVYTREENSCSNCDLVPPQ